MEESNTKPLAAEGTQGQTRRGLAEMLTEQRRENSGLSGPHTALYSPVGESHYHGLWWLS